MKNIVVDCLLQKGICLKPSFNIFSIIKRNLGELRKTVAKSLGINPVPFLDIEIDEGEKHRHEGGKHHHGGHHGHYKWWKHGGVPPPGFGPDPF